MAHAHASPSSSEIWIACPASVTLARGRQRKATFYTREGTCAHHIAERTLVDPKFVTKAGDKWVVEGEEIEVTEEMLEAVQTYVSYVRSLPGTVEIETRVKLGSANGSEETWGTADAFAVDEISRIVEIADLKYGAGVWVPADTSQFRIYALGVLEHVGPFVDIRDVRMTVVQPRMEGDTVRSAIISVPELTAWETETLRPALDRLHAGDTTEIPGDHCRWCVRAGECRALASRAMTEAKATFDVVGPEPVGFTNDELGAILEQGELIMGWLNKVRAEVSSGLDNGQPVPGWKLVPKRAMRKWVTDYEDMVIDTLTKAGLDELDITRIETIGNVEKAMKRHKLPLTILDEFTVKESSGTTLAHESDGRPAVDTSSKNAFDAIEMLD